MNLLDDPRFWISIVGAAASVFGVYFAIRAWREAIAAKKAATAAANQVRGINAVVATATLQMLCREISRLFDSKAYRPARYSVREVLIGVNQLKANPNTNGHLDQGEWGEMTASLADVEDALADAQDGRIFQGLPHCRQVIRAVGEKIVLIASKCKTAAEELQ